MTNQYESLYNKKRKCIPSAEACYIPRLDTENPYATALPPVRDTVELFRACTNFPGLPPTEQFVKLEEKEQLSLINKLSRATVCLPYYSKIEKSVDRALVESYEKRVCIESQRPYRQYTFQDVTQDSYQHMEITEMSDAPTGFCLLGRSGCGKTTGINIVLRKYPKCIIHNPNTMQQSVQIPILAIQMPENSNFHGLYLQIGKQIDATLGNNLRIYENLFSRSRDSLSTKFNRLCDLIRVFNIGMLIVDEIELIQVNHVKEGTLETFMSLTNQTGITVGVIGTEDAFGKLFRHPRTTRRLGDLINADDYCSSKNNIQKILRTLYTYLPEQIELTEECLNAYYIESGGTIAYISKIFVGVTKEVYHLKAQNKPATITPELIIRVAKRCLAGKQVFDKNCPENRIIEDDEYSQAIMREFLGKKENEEEFPVPATPREDYMPTLRNIVKMAIHAFPNSTYTDEEIESALHAVTKKVPDDDTQAVIRATFIELKRREESKIKKIAKKEQEKQSLVDLEALKKSLPVSSDV